VEAIDHNSRHATLGARAHQLTHTQSCMSTIDRTLSAIERTCNKGSRDLLLGHFSPSPHHFPPCAELIPAPSHLYLAPTCTLHTPKHSLPSPTAAHSHSPATTRCHKSLLPTHVHHIFHYYPVFHRFFSNPHTPLFHSVFLFVSIFDNCSLCKRVVVVFYYWFSMILQGVGKSLEWICTTWFESCTPSIPQKS
jgi:hypothetical protein